MNLHNSTSTKSKSSKIAFVVLFIFILILNMSTGLFTQKASAQSTTNHWVIDKYVQPIVTIAKGDYAKGTSLGVKVETNYTGIIPMTVTDMQLCAYTFLEDIDMLNHDGTDDCGEPLIIEAHRDSIVMDDIISVDESVPTGNHKSTEDDTISGLKLNTTYYIQGNYEMGAGSDSASYYGYTNTIKIQTPDTSTGEIIIVGDDFLNNKRSKEGISNYSKEQPSWNSNTSYNNTQFAKVNVGMTAQMGGVTKFSAYFENTNATQITINSASIHFNKTLSNLSYDGTTTPDQKIQAITSKVIDASGTTSSPLASAVLDLNQTYYVAVVFDMTVEGKQIKGYGIVMQIKTGSPSVTLDDNLKNGASDAGAGTGVVTDPGTGAQADPNETKPTCISNFTSINLPGCFALFFYYVLFKPASWLMMLGGSILDYGIFYTTQSKNYDSNQSFIENGWKMTRDISNLVFIFVILLFALKLITGSGKGSASQFIVMVIVVGIFINFSLFAGRIIIDAGNILTRVMYNAITVTESSGGEAEIKPLSTYIVQKFNPQQLLLGASLGKDPATMTSDGDYSYNFMLLSICVGIIALLTAWLFFTCGFVFIGRTLTLWLHLILAPFAFISQVWGGGAAQTSGIKKGTGVDISSISTWAVGLAKASFAIVAFLFFIILIIKFTTSYDFLGAGFSNQDPLSMTLNVLIPFIFIFFMLQAAKSTAVDLSGKFGEMVEKAGKAATGAVLTTAALATGLGATRLLGAAGAAAESKYGASLATRASKGGAGGWLAKKQLNLVRGAQTKEFNFSKSKLGQIASKNLGGDKYGELINKGIKGAGRLTGADMQTEGGYAGARGRQVKRKEEEEKKYSALSGEAAKAQDKRALDWEKKYQAAMGQDKAQKEAAGIKFDEDYFKNDYIANSGNGLRPKTADQMNKENQRSFAEKEQNSVFKGYRDYADKTLESHKEGDIKNQQADWDKEYVGKLKVAMQDNWKTKGRKMTNEEKKAFKKEYEAGNPKRPMTNEEIKSKINSPKIKTPDDEAKEIDATETDKAKVKNEQDIQAQKDWDASYVNALNTEMRRVQASGRSLTPQEIKDFKDKYIVDKGERPTTKKDREKGPKTTTEKDLIASNKDMEKNIKAREKHEKDKEKHEKFKEEKIKENTRLAEDITKKNKEAEYIEKEVERVRAKMPPRLVLTAEEAKSRALDEKTKEIAKLNKLKIEQSRKEAAEARELKATGMSDRKIEEALLERYGKRNLTLKKGGMALNEERKILEKSTQAIKEGIDKNSDKINKNNAAISNAPHEDDAHRWF